MSSCSNCGSFEIDHSGSVSQCEDCGAILSEAAVVSSVSFDDCSVVGTHVSGNGGFLSSSARAPAGAGFGKESREVILERGRRRIRELAGMLGLSTRLVDGADRLFRLCVQNNFIQGRKTDNVLAVCLYVVCRQQQTAHMLIDFSDILSTNMFVLGNTFLKMIQLLNLSIPPVDPSFFIHRFASKLELGDKAHEVALTALKIVARMKRDWMTTGRRPSGICGAALLVAGRFHGFKRSQQEITDVVHICEVTLRKRLNELAMTPAGEMTLEELDQLTEEAIEASETKMIPPAMQNNLFKEEELIAKLAKGIEDSIAMKQVEEIETYLKLCASDPEAAAMALIPEESIQDTPAEEADPEEETDTEETPEQTASAKDGKTGKSKRKAVRKRSSTERKTKVRKVEKVAFMLTDEVKDRVRVRRQKEMARRQQQKLVEERAWELELQHEGFDDLVDEELEVFRLNDEASAFKEKMWTEMNGDWLKKQAAKEKLEAEQLANGVVPTKKRRLYKRKDHTADNAVDATMNVLAEKKVSKVINYDVLQNLLNVDNDDLEGKDVSRALETEKEDETLRLLSEQAAQEEAARIAKGGEEEEGQEGEGEEDEAFDAGFDEDDDLLGDYSDNGGDDATMALKRQFMGAEEEDDDDFD
eukprot:gb/GEZN01004083.1/.p1 GENE.gb/GEZN01004083.1/~~gb/GEZN01004083.1/.p1  ORF type:complete len:644 (+),score=167.64 gb/GEZN01004083.1/:54-1985(+)